MTTIPDGMSCLVCRARSRGGQIVHKPTCVEFEGRAQYAPAARRDDLREAQLDAVERYHRFVALLTPGRPGRYECPGCGAPGDGHGLKVDPGNSGPLFLCFSCCPTSAPEYRSARSFIIEQLGLHADDVYGPRIDEEQVDAWLRSLPENTPPGDNAEPSRFAATLMRRSELATLPPVEPLIDGIMSLRGTVVFVGSTGAGKTFVALSWACSIATGHNWLGHDVRRSPVLYTVGEGANGLDDRISAWEHAWQTKVSDTDLILSIRPASLRDITTWIEMRGEALRLDCRVIILDTFSSLAPDADETKDAASLLRRMADLAAAIDGTVILVHHPGWGDVTRARGGSQLEANADEVLILYGNAGSDLIELERKKVKEGPAGTRMWLRRKAQFGSVVIEAARATEAETPIRDRIVAALRDMGDTGATGPQLMLACGVSADRRTSLYKALRGLVEDDRVIKEGRRRFERYTLAEGVTQP